MVGINGGKAGRDEGVSVKRRMKRRREIWRQKEWTEKMKRNERVEEEGKGRRG